MLTSWISREEVYWSLSDVAGFKFAKRVTAPEGGEKGSSIALLKRKGEVFLAWRKTSR